MKVTEKDIVPGAILYYVSCVDAFDKNPELSCSVEVITRVNSENNIQSKRFTSVDDYRKYSFAWVNYDADHFLNDCGVNATRYNLHKLFTTQESALAYVEECKTGVFTDPLDQDYYNHSLKNPKSDYDDFMFDF